jgi:hypothetical protein
MTMRWRPLLVAVTCVCCGCGSSPTSPSSTSSSTTTSSTPVPGLFELTVSPGTDRFYSFTQSTNGDATATLGSVTIGRSPAAVPVAMRLGIGVPAGEGCSVTTSMDVTPSLITQLTATLVAGTYCVDVADIGNLTSDAVVSVRLAHK